MNYEYSETKNVSNENVDDRDKVTDNINSLVTIPFISVIKYCMKFVLVSLYIDYFLAKRHPYISTCA